MSYNSDLQENNEELQAILKTVNALPDANSGGYSTYYADAEIPYPIDEGVNFFVAMSKLSNEGAGIKEGDLVISSNGTLCKVTLVQQEYSRVNCFPLASIASSGGNAEDGFSPIAKVEQTATGAVISITDKNGETTATITNGKDGKDGTDGKDYVLTEADKSEIMALVIETLGGNPIFGYVDSETMTVVLKNAPDGEYSLAYLKDDGSVSAPIGSMVKDTNVYYSVTNNLTNCTSSNSAKQVVEGESYSATITAVSGYELKSVTVTMGGSPVTVSGGNISIANVTGNIVITAVAEEIIIDESNLVKKSLDADGVTIYNGGLGYRNGYYPSSTGMRDGEDSACVTTGLIPNVLKSTSDSIYVKGATLDTAQSHVRFVGFSDISTVFDSTYTAGNWNNVFSIETINTNYYKLTPINGYITKGYPNCEYFRIGLIGTGENLVISTEPIV